MNNNEILFWKVFHNKYLFNFIFEKIIYQDIVYFDNLNKNYLGNRIQFKDINSLGWMVEKNQYSLLIDKVYSNQFIDIDIEHIRVLFKNCKDEKILSVLFEKKKDQLTQNDTRQLFDISIACNNIVALKLLIENKEFYNNNNSTNKNGFINQSALIINTIQKGYVDVLKYLISIGLPQDKIYNLLNYNLLSMACDNIVDSSNMSSFLINNEFFQSIIFSNHHHITTTATNTTETNLKNRNYNVLTFHQYQKLESNHDKKKIMNFNDGILIFKSYTTPHFKEIAFKIFNKDEQDIENLIFHFKDLFKFSSHFKEPPITTKTTTTTTTTKTNTIPLSIQSIDSLKDIKEIRKQFTIMNILSTVSNCKNSNNNNNKCTLSHFHFLNSEDNCLYHYLLFYDDLSGLEEFITDDHLFIVYKYTINVCSFIGLQFLVKTNFFSIVATQQPKREVPFNISFIDNNGGLKNEIFKYQKRLIQFLEYYFETEQQQQQQQQCPLFENMEILFKTIVEQFSDENLQLIESLFIKYKELLVKSSITKPIGFIWSSNLINTKVLSIKRYIWLIKKEIENDHSKVLKVNLNLPFPIDDQRLIDFIVENKNYYKLVFQNKNFILKFTNLNYAIQLNDRLNNQKYQDQTITNNVFSFLFQNSILTTFDLNCIKWIDNNLNFKFFIKNLTSPTTESVESTQSLSTTSFIKEKIELLNYLIETGFISMKEECISSFLLYNLKFITQHSIDLLNLKNDYLIKILSTLLFKPILFDQIEFILKHLTLKKTTLLLPSHLLKNPNNIQSLSKVFLNNDNNNTTSDNSGFDENLIDSSIIINLIQSLLLKKELLFQIYSNQSIIILFSYSYRMLLNSKNITFSKIESIFQLLSNSLIDIIDESTSDNIFTKNLYNYFYHLIIKDIRLTRILGHIVKNHLYSFSMLSVDINKKASYFSKLDNKILNNDQQKDDDFITPEIYNVLMKNRLTFNQIKSSSFNEIVLSLVNQTLQISKNPISDSDSIFKLLVGSTSNLTAIINVLKIKSIYKDLNCDPKVINILKFIKHQQFESFIEIFNPNNLYQLLLNGIYNTNINFVDYLLKNYNIPIKIEAFPSRVLYSFSKSVHFEIFNYLYNNNILKLYNKNGPILSTTTTIPTTDGIRGNNKFIIPMSTTYGLKNTISAYTLFGDTELNKLIDNIK